MSESPRSIFRPEALAGRRRPPSMQTPQAVSARALRIVWALVLGLLALGWGVWNRRVDVRWEGVGFVADSPLEPGASALVVVFPARTNPVAGQTVRLRSDPARVFELVRVEPGVRDAGEIVQRFAAGAVAHASLRDGGRVAFAPLAPEDPLRSSADTAFPIETFGDARSIRSLVDPNAKARR